MHAIRRTPLALTLLLTTTLLTTACQSSSVDPTALYTLETCTTEISSQAPAFFQELYRCATITTSGGVLRVESLGLPPHKSYYYGEDNANYEAFDTTRGSQYHPNPNMLAEQDLWMEVPLEPVARGLTITADMVDASAGTSEYEYHSAPGGFALNGVALFHGYAAPGDDINQEKYTFDIYNGHPENTGTYHYHSPTMGPLEVLVDLGMSSSSTPGSGQLEIFGMMCDGTVVLGCTEADGDVIQGPLDAQGGHVMDIVSDSGEVWFAERYHTHVCEGVRSFTPEIQYYDTCTVPAPSGPPPQ